MYKQAQQSAGPGPQTGAGPTPEGPSPDQSASAKDGAVDADFEVVDDDKK
jgi:hypothetical protein